MIRITEVENIDGKKRIALLDTSSVSFLQRLSEREIAAGEILKDYDLILIPCWVLEELNDAVGRAAYVQRLIDAGYLIFSISEEVYSDLAKKEEGNLYQIVLASTYQIGRVKSYLRRFVEKNDILDMEAYRIWINRLYEKWPIPGEVLSSGRIKKKNAGEVSITILAEVVSWYYPETEGLTIYSQDSDTYEFQRKAEERLRTIFTSRVPIPVSYKSNDAILCQLYREEKISLEKIRECRKDIRRITYSKQREDHSVILVTETVEHESFLELVQDNTVQDNTVQIIF